MDQSLIERIADRAAEEAIRRTFLALGVDVATPESVIQVQQDFRFIRDQRLSAAEFRRSLKKGARYVGWSVVGTVALSLVGWVLASFHITPIAGPGP